MSLSVNCWVDGVFMRAAALFGDPLFARPVFNFDYVAAYLLFVGFGDALPAIIFAAFGEPRPIIVPLAGDPRFIKAV